MKNGKDLLNNHHKQYLQTVKLTFKLVRGHITNIIHFYNFRYKIAAKSQQWVHKLIFLIKEHNILDLNLKFMELRYYNVN